MGKSSEKIAEDEETGLRRFCKPVFFRSFQESLAFFLKSIGKKSVISSCMHELFRERIAAFLRFFCDYIGMTVIS